MIWDALGNDSGVSWGILIAQIIPRMPYFLACGDACLYGGGGFSFDMKFYWNLKWPEEFKSHM